jgi:hypothetical protein
VVIQSSINSQLENSSNDIGFKLIDFNITALNENSISCNFTFNVPESTNNPNTRFKLLESTFYYNQSLISIAKVIDENHLFDLSKEIYFVEVHFWLENFDFINTIVQDILNGYVLNITFESQIKLLGFASILPPFNILFSSQINSTYWINFIDDYINFEKNNINIGLADLNFNLNYTIEIQNPFNFSIDITSFNSFVTYNDEDGLGELLPQSNILIAELSYNWEQEPIHLTANGTGSKEILFSKQFDDLYDVLRLYYEYYENKLHINLVNTTIGLKIANFDFSIAFHLNQIFIPVLKN